ncbi:hypothetical protein JCM11641_001732 [Rhodosporidiobolus odoratus]
MTVEKPLLVDSKHSLPLPASSVPLPPHNHNRSRIPRWVIVLLTVASVAVLCTRYAPVGYLEGAHTFAGLVKGNHAVNNARCRHDHELGTHRLTWDRIEHNLLSIPSAAGAKIASYSYTQETHVAGTSGDRKIALLLKEQWEGLLGLEKSGEGKVYDAGTDEDHYALTGHGRGETLEYGDREPRRLRYHGKKGLKVKAKRTARHLLERAGLPVPSFLACRSRLHHHRRHRHCNRHSDPEPPRVWTSAYYPLLNYPISASVSYTPPNAEEPSFRAKLKEEVYDKDPTSKDGVPVWHGYSANGTARGQLVYASKGAPEDFAELARRGIDVRGKVVLVQYGGLFRGLKVRAAADAGAVGVLVYTDPNEDGEVIVENGYEAYPEGPARAPSSIQRGSVQYLSLYPGDPLTPGEPSYNPTLPNAPARLPRNSSDVNMPPIPSLPLSYEDAVPLLKLLNGRGSRLEDGREGKPDGWREGGLGGKGVEYWTGPSEGEVEVVNEVKEDVTAIWNTYALVPGRLSDEVVILGNHHDAWDFGAGDPSSGTAAVHEIVRALGVLLKKGWRPLRSILIAGWDGEEYGLLGSTEFGEDHSTWLQERVVAYLNVDVAASGSVYGLNASPSLANLLKEVSAKVEDPYRAGKTLAEAHSASEGVEQVGLVQAGEAVSEKELKVGALGSGSDFTVFLQRLGIASANVGYRRSSKDPVYHYHSNYDSFYWQSTFGDPTFKHHEAVAKVLALTLGRLADDPVLPINVTAYATALGEYVQKVATLPGAEELDLSHLYVLTLAIESSASDLSRHAKKLVKKLEDLRAFHDSRSHSHPHKDKKKFGKIVRELREINGKLRRFEQGFLGDQKGLKGREWYRHLGVAPGRWLGYGATTLPGLTEALTVDKDMLQAKEEVERLEKVFQALLDRLRK